MTFLLPPLPYAYDALEPVLTRSSVQRHYEQNHAGYVKKLNLLSGGRSMEDILTNEPSGTPLYNCAAQDWIHTFWWNNMAPVGTGGDPIPEIKDVPEFNKRWVKAGSNLFGSGWLWLIYSAAERRLDIATTQNADMPQRRGKVPILVMDLWEHTYTCQYGSNRAEYLTRSLDIIDWNRVAQRLQLRRSNGV